MNKYVQIVFFLKSGKTLTENVYLPKDNEETIIKLKEIKNKEENVKRCIANNHMGCVEFNNLIVNIPSLEAIRFSYIGLEEYLEN